MEQGKYIQLTPTRLNLQVANYTTWNGGGLWVRAKEPLLVVSWRSVGTMDAGSVPGMREGGSISRAANVSSHCPIRVMIISFMVP
ncbi:protein of unknown function [Mesotoga infera]|uniref:Uncharacterized protein n=1 Tax=Mesotoga infera TaxID=1236046 RepID=A0A7Z7LED1_9BACT|nr:protein of unknown function [Mesotoga infera]